MSTSPGAPAADRPPGVPRRRLPRNVIALGFTSLFNDFASEMIVPVLPLFITGTLKASVLSLGIIEGVAESAASLLRLGAGWLSDRTGKRKPLVVAGYGLSTTAKASLALANSWSAVLGLRFSDRLGKALRNPPRDALLADSVDRRDFGRAFGFHRAMDTAGAALGPLAAFALLSLFPGDFRRIFLLSAVPGLLALVAVVVFVKPVVRAAAAPAKGWRRTWSDLGAPFRRFIIADGVFRLGSSSLAFVLLRAHDAGIAEAAVPLVYLAYNVVYAVLSYPFGQLSDRLGRRIMLVAGYALFAVTYVLLSSAGTPAVVIAAFLLLGVHSALIDGQQRSFVADLVPPETRGTAFGFYHLIVGGAMLPASAVAGFLWDRAGPEATFLLSAGLAILAMVLFLVILPPRAELKDRHGNTG